jgi:ABC-type Na+ efflux pump permease subunit
MSLFLIAKWEVLRSRSRFTPRLVLSSLLLFALVVLFFVLVLGTQADIGAGLYRAVLVGEDPVAREAILSDGRFVLEEASVEEALASLKAGTADIAVVSEGEKVSILQPTTARGEGALDALYGAVRRYKLELIWVVEDREVPDAFPLWVETHYLEREQEFQYTALGGIEAAGEEGFYETPEIRAEIEALKPRPVEEVMEELRFARRRGGGVTIGERQVTLPYFLSPPLPFRSVILTFFLALPVYLFAQFYSSSMMDEKINRRVQLLLASPVSPWEIVAGKTSVYLLLCLLTTGAVSALLKGGFDPYILALLFPVILFFLSLGFLAAVLSRSYKENSFITVFFSVVFFAYLFFPAMFSGIHVASGISPVTFIVSRLENETFQFSGYLFSTLPLYLTSGLVFYFGGLLFREEYLFSQAPMTDRLLDAGAAFLKSWGSRYTGVLVLGAVAVAPVFLAELMLIVLLFQVPYPFSIGAMVILSAMAEEVAKVFGVAALFSRGLLRPTARNCLTMAALSAAGFFMAEKAMALLALSKVTESLFGAVMFMKTYFLLGLLFHVITAMVASLGLLASDGKIGGRLILSVGAAAAIHAVYNASLLGGVLG